MPTSTPLTTRSRGAGVGSSTALGRLGSVFGPVAVPAVLGAGGTGFCLHHQRRTVHPIGCVTQPTEWK
jgi:hypothetical protein